MMRLCVYRPSISHILDYLSMIYVGAMQESFTEKNDSIICL